MFERLLFAMLTETITTLATPDMNGAYPKLRRMWKMPERTEDEIDKLAAFFLDEGRPGVRHGFAQGGPPLPCFSITLGGKRTDPEYLGARAGAGISVAVRDFIKAVEKELGKTIDVFVDKQAVNYDIWTYTKTPDVCIAYSAIVEDIVTSQRRRLIREGLDLVGWSMQDVIPDQRYLPAGIFVRQFAIQGVVHVLSSDTVDLGAYATARGTTVGRIHVANHVTGVNPGVTPIEG